MTVSIKGGKELDEYLSKFPLEVQRKVLRNALRRGANVIRDDARNRIHSKSGLTRRAVKSGTNIINGLPVGRVRLRGRNSYVGYLLEWGVGAHFISAGDSGLSPRKLTQSIGPAGVRPSANNPHVMKIGDRWVGGAILHPGFAPKPFLRPALDAKAAEAVQAVGDYIRTWLNIGTLQAPAIEADDE